MSEFPARAQPIYEAVWQRKYWGEAGFVFADTFDRHDIGETGVRFVSAKVDPIYQSFTYLLRRRNGELLEIELPWSHKEDLEEVYRLYCQELPEKAIECIRLDALNAWFLLTQSFHSSAIAGQTAVWARVGSALAPVSAIPSDVWAHFVVTNWERGVALCEESRERLFSVHAQQVGFIDPDESDDPAAALTAEISRLERPMTIAEMTVWAAERSLPREFVRQYRRDLPVEAKLMPGEKRGDRSPNR